MSLVLGIDSSTQSTKALLVEAETGKVVAQKRHPHPDGTSCNPAAWLEALHNTCDELLPRAEAVAVAGQQHGMVVLDENDRVIRDALLWNDTRSAAAAKDLIAELGGKTAAAQRTGSVHVASITSTKLRWLRDAEPDNARRVRRVVLPHDYLSHELNADKTVWFTDRGDASGTGYFSPRKDAWDTDLLIQALGHEAAVPDLPVSPNQNMGKTETGAVIAPGTGDNMAAALGLAMGAGDVSLSVGTSGVAAMVSSRPTFDATGSVTGFADATGNWLPLACTINAAKILDLGARLLGVNHEEFSQLALAAPPGANGVTLLPYLDGERTPNRPGASGMFRGLRSTSTREDLARAFVEGLACSLVDAAGFLREATGETVNRYLLIGGGAKSKALQQILPGVLECPVILPPPGEYVALGAAAQAAWVLSGSEQPPRWELTGTGVLESKPCPQVLDKYHQLAADTANAPLA
ncbi:xylulokinase [Mobiluncus mulieris]|uniref:Xylulose kinase n=1 Tax=Mobiluncus mulieris TaxID=2052 RepID=A0A7Y0UU32_9ACTO|nr:xylulokinase [Mobiluncus mulieris]NMX03760.1 xylulokinase [Mobiluncus mulieris]